VGAVQRAGSKSRTSHQHTFRPVAVWCLHLIDLHCIAASRAISVVRHNDARGLKPGNGRTWRRSSSCSSNSGNASLDSWRACSYASNLLQPRHISQQVRMYLLQSRLEVAMHTRPRSTAAVLLHVLTCSCQEEHVSSNICASALAAHSTDYWLRILDAWSPDQNDDVPGCAPC
jgi:hypothetical protein